MAPLLLSLSLLLTGLLIAMTSAGDRSTSYIRTSCSRTLYPELCYSSLSPYAGQVGTDPVLLARFAMNVTLGRLKPLYVDINYLRSHAAADPSCSCKKTAEALDDCSELISDTIGLVRKSEKELTGLEGMVGPQVTWRIGNAQTWLSATITDESTCTDGFGDGCRGTGDDIEQEIRKKVTTAEQLTSIALALVSGLVKS